MMRGPEFAGIRIARVSRRRSPATTGSTRSTPSAGARSRSISSTSATSCSRSVTRARPSASARSSPPPATSSSPPTRCRASGGARTARSTAPDRSSGSVPTRRRSWNEHLRVDVSPDDGTFTVTTADGLVLPGCNRLVDGGDGGDTYNYSPPTVDRVVDRPVDVQVEVVDDGPVRAARRDQGSVRAARSRPSVTSGRARAAPTRPPRSRSRRRWSSGPPSASCASGSSSTTTCRDHRLRAHFPLPAPVTGSDAECAFTVVHRGLTAEGGPNEVGLPTFVSRRFVDCSDGETGSRSCTTGCSSTRSSPTTAARHRARAHAPARRRATSPGPSSRCGPNPAGPLDPLEGPQLQGRHVVEYAVLPHRGDWRAARLYDAADELLVPLERVRARWRARGVARPDRPGAGRRRRRGVGRPARRGALVVRVFNVSPEPSVARVARGADAASGEIVDLRGRVTGTFAGDIELRPWEIVTLRLAD